MLQPIGCHRRFKILPISVKKDDNFRFDRYTPRLPHCFSSGDEESRKEEAIMTLEKRKTYSPPVERSLNMCISNMSLGI